MYPVFKVERERVRCRSVLGVTSVTGPVDRSLIHSSKTSAWPETKGFGGSGVPSYPGSPTC
jgi:hypothetical protein